jgi:hypothetical protein
MAQCRIQIRQPVVDDYGHSRAACCPALLPQLSVSSTDWLLSQIKPHSPTHHALSHAALPSLSALYHSPTNRSHHACSQQQHTTTDQLSEVNSKASHQPCPSPRPAIEPRCLWIHQIPRPAHHLSKSSTVPTTIGSDSTITATLHSQ